MPKVAPMSELEVAGYTRLANGDVDFNAYECPFCGIGHGRLDVQTGPDNWLVLTFQCGHTLTGDHAHVYAAGVWPR